MAAARRQGIRAVIWLTLRTAEVAYPPRGFESASLGFGDNNRILLQKSRQYGGRLQIADWAGHSANRPSWVGRDGSISHRRGRLPCRRSSPPRSIGCSPVRRSPRPSRGRHCVSARAAQGGRRSAGRDQGRHPPTGGANGVYGPGPRSAVRTYQGASDLSRHRHGDSAHRQGDGDLRLPPEPPVILSVTFPPTTTMRPTTAWSRRRFRQRHRRRDRAVHHDDHAGVSIVVDLIEGRSA